MPLDANELYIYVYISLEMTDGMLTKYDGSKARIHEILDNCDIVNNLINPNLQKILLISLYYEYLQRNIFREQEMFLCR